MKVCHMTSAHSSEDVRIFHKECVSLAKAGYEVYEVAHGDSYDKRGVHIVGIGKPPAGRLKRMTKAVNAIYRKALELDCDIYHFHDPELLPYGLKLKKAGKRVIFDSHECYTAQIANKHYLGKIAPVISKIYGFYENWALKRLDCIIFPCLIHGRNPFEGRCARTEIIGNYPILEEVYSEIEKDFCGEQIACYAGAIRYDRGLDQDVLACNQVGIKLLLAGKESSAEYKEKLIALDQKKVVEFTGVLNRQEISALLRKATIGLVTELNIGQNNQVDTLPTKTYEYMGSGIPVVISQSAYADQMLAKYGFGIGVDPENVDEIAKAIQYLLDHPEEAKRMGENGRKAVAEEFNWGMEEKKLIGLYQELAK